MAYLAEGSWITDLRTKLLVTLSGGIVIESCMNRNTNNIQG